MTGSHRVNQIILGKKIEEKLENREEENKTLKTDHDDTDHYFDHPGFEITEHTIPGNDPLYDFMLEEEAREEEMQTYRRTGNK